MPKAIEQHQPKRDGWDFTHGDKRGAIAPFCQARQQIFLKWVSLLVVGSIVLELVPCRSLAGDERLPRATGVGYWQGPAHYSLLLDEKLTVGLREDHWHWPDYPPPPPEPPGVIAGTMTGTSRLISKSEF